ncbi:MAG: hypothetical protein NWP54_00715, partial [Polaribacter sp.]|nr:hypothetical protein [Polaribacter sp.]
MKKVTSIILALFAGIVFTSCNDDNETVETNTIVSISVIHDPANGIFGDKFNPNDKITLDSGLGIVIIFTNKGRKASTGDHYVYDGKTVGPAILFSA